MVALQEKRHGLTETVTTPENQRQHGRAWVGSPASLFLSHSHSAVTINVGTALTEQEVRELVVSGDCGPLRERLTQQVTDRAFSA